MKLGGSQAGQISTCNPSSYSWSASELDGDHTYNVFFAHDQHFIPVHFYGGARILAEQNSVADLDCERSHFAIVHHLAGADRDYFALIRLFGSVSGYDDPAGGRAFFFNA